MTEFMTMIYFHDREMLWWTWFDFMTIIWFDEHDMIWCTWYDFMTMIWFRDRIHDHDILSWPWNALMNMIWFHDNDLICWTWYDFMTMIWCHDHDMMSWPWFDFMTMIWFHDHDMMSWTWYDLMNMIWFHDHDMISWRWKHIATCIITCHAHHTITLTFTGLLVSGHLRINLTLGLARSLEYPKSHSLPFQANTAIQFNNALSQATRNWHHSNDEFASVTTRKLHSRQWAWYHYVDNNRLVGWRTGTDFR